MTPLFAVGRDHERESHKTKIEALLFGVSALGDRGGVVSRVDEGGEVGHVQHEPGQIQVELGLCMGGYSTFDLGEHLGGQGLHGVPEAAVIQSGGILPPRPGDLIDDLHDLKAGRFLSRQ